MNNLEVISFLLIGVVSFVAFLKDSLRLTNFNLLLILMAVTVLISSEIANEESKSVFTWVSIGYLALLVVLSFIEKINKSKLKVLLPTVVSAVFLFIGNTIEYNEYVLSVRTLPIFGLILFGAMAPEISRFAGRLINKVFSVDKQSIEITLMLFFVGFSSFIGSFFACYFGVFLITLGFAGNVFVYQGRNKHVLLSLVLLSSIGVIAQGAEIDLVDLTLGKTMEGLFFGAFAFFLVHIISISKKTSILLTGAVLFLAVFILLGIALLGTQKTDFGGIDAFIASMLGVALLLVLFPKNQLGSLLVSILFVIGVFVGPQTINLEEKAATTISIVQDNADSGNEQKKEESIFVLPGKSLDSLQGRYSIQEKTVQMNFELGPKGGRTKGAIKQLKGKIGIAKDIEQSTFEIEMPVAGLTTFNKYRDESLMDEGYFNTIKFPVFKFSSSKMKVKNDGYELEGVFTMLGVSKSQIVEIKYLGEMQNGDLKSPVLIGRGTIDRTKFGMKSDPKEGDVVEFEFRIDLEK